MPTRLAESGLTLPMKLFRQLLLLSIALMASATHAQDPLLRVIGSDGTERAVTAQIWATLPRTAVAAVGHDGRSVSFEGVAARELLALVNVPSGTALRGKSLTLYVVAEAADGYRVVYALPEFDAAFTDGLILVADRRDGKVLADDEGPVRLVVPWEKRQARWARQLLRLRVEQAP